MAEGNGNGNPLVLNKAVRRQSSRYGSSRPSTAGLRTAMLRPGVSGVSGAAASRQLMANTMRVGKGGSFTTKTSLRPASKRPSTGKSGVVVGTEAAGLGVGTGGAGAASLGGGKQSVKERVGLPEEVGGKLTIGTEPTKRKSRSRKRRSRSKSAKT